MYEKLESRTRELKEDREKRASQLEKDTCSTENVESFLSDFSSSKTGM
jgi:hypothetical protein